jgi:para-nitrobenzyl esterase
LRCKPVSSLLLAVSFLVACSDGSDQSPPGSNTSVDEVITPEPEPLAPLGLEVTLSSGPIAGRESDRAASWEYLGIPYAAPPVGDLRWRAPQSVTPWTDVMDSTTLPDFCPQFLYFSGEFAGSEDCLYLNVFRPQSEERDLPVLVWIHGGGNNNGDTGQETPVYNGARMAQRGNLVVVTIQYRLGALGWLYSSALQGDDPVENSGNYGTLDIIETLKWVQANAGAFGGDANNVTIAGESAGGANVLTLVISDLAQGLFHRGIVQSLGGSVNDTQRVSEQAEVLVDDLMALEGAPEFQMSEEELADYLRNLDAETLLSVARTSEIIGDGVVIPTEGYGVLDTGNFPNKVPLLFGTNKDEQKLYTNPLGFNAYPDSSDELRAAVGRYLSDAWRVSGADALASRLRQLDDMPDLYVYRFNWGSTDEDGNSPLPGDFGDTGGAFHSAEISFMMGNEDIFIFPDFTSIFFTEDNQQSRETMADIMVSYWSNFARSADPNGNSLPVWEPWSNSQAGFKAVTLDVNYADNSPRVEPDNTVFTEQSVYDEANANLQGAVLAEVLQRLDQWFGN